MEGTLIERQIRFTLTVLTGYSQKGYAGYHFQSRYQTAVPTHQLIVSQQWSLRMPTGQRAIFKHGQSCRRCNSRQICRVTRYVSRKRLIGRDSM